VSDDLAIRNIVSFFDDVIINTVVSEEEGTLYMFPSGEKTMIGCLGA